MCKEQARRPDVLERRQPRVVDAAAARLGKPGDLRHPIADRDQKHLTVSAATQANARDFVKWHIDPTAHLQPSTYGFPPWKRSTDINGQFIPIFQ